MKKALWTILFFVAGFLRAQESTPTATVFADATPSAASTVISKWTMGAVPWDAWFKDNAMVTDKTDYVHFFWNAQDFKSNFEVKDKKLRLSEAALQLVARLYPADAKADPVKVDIVYVLERDSYGQPKWDSLEQVAHFEFLKSKVLKLAKGKKQPSLTALQKAFKQSVMY